LKVLTLSDHAIDDIERLVAFVKDRTPLLETRLRAALVEKMKSLSTDFELGLPVDKDIRETYARFGRSRYVIRYKVLETEVLLLRIWHGREAR
jgi:plasmid stabilization system protein ParE